MWKKVLAGLALVILLAIGVAMQFGGTAATRLVAQMLENQDAVQGTIKYDKIDASWSGDVQIHNLRWVAVNGSKKAEIPLLTLSVNLWETLTHGGGVASINSVILDRPHFYGIYTQEKGLDILHGLQFAGETPATAYKPVQEVKPTQFRGEVDIKDGIFDLLADSKPVQFTKISGQGLFKQYPLLQFNLTAVNGSSAMVFNIEKKEQDINVKGEVKNGQVTDFVPFLPNLKDIVIKSGTVETANIVANKQPENRWAFTMGGTLKDLTGNGFGWDFSQGTSKFAATWENISLEKLTCKVDGMPVEVTGNIKTSAGLPDPAVYDLKVTAPVYAVKSLSAGLDVAGNLSAQGTIAGSVLEPKFEGRVHLDALTAGPLHMQELNGLFKCANNELHLGEVKGTAASGAIRLNGTVNLTQRDFKLELDGIDLQLAELMADKIGGKLQFTSVFTGSNAVDTVTGTGSFQAPEGYFGDDKMKNLAGRIAVQNGHFGLTDVAMRKGFKVFDLKLALDNNKKVTVADKDGKIKFF
jgi:hypothetical protein